MCIYDNEIYDHAFMPLFHDATSQEKELHWHCQLHFALWGVPSWTYWPKGYFSTIQIVHALFSFSNVFQLCAWVFLHSYDTEQFSINTGGCRACKGDEACQLSGIQITEAVVNKTNM